jgi:hypothetical protein
VLAVDGGGVVDMKNLSIYRPLVVNPDGSVRKMTRGDCISGTPGSGSKDDRIAGRKQCSVYACRFNLLVDASEDVPGRRHDGLAPPWTLSGRVDATAPSCALDVADTGPKSAAEIADMMGFDDKRRIEQLLKQALSSEAGVELWKLRREG